MAEELDYRKVLRKCIFRLKEDLEPESILDEFTASDYLTPIAIRDIRETSTTTKKNEAIVNNVLTKGIKGYKKFKRFLRNTYQGHLADVLEEMEKKVQKDQKSKSGPNLGGQDVRGSQYDPGRLTAHNYGGQYSQNMSAAGINFGVGDSQLSGNPGRSTVQNYGGQDSLNMFDGYLNVNNDITFRGNRSNPSSGQNNPLMAARHLPRDQSATGIGSRNVGGDNAFNVYGGHVNVQGNMVFGGGHPEIHDRNQPGYPATNNKSHIWNNQNQQPEQLRHPEIHDRNQPGYPATNNKSHIWNNQNQQPEQLRQRGNIKNVQQQFSQITLENPERSSTMPGQQHIEPGNPAFSQHYQFVGSGRVQQPHSELSALESFGHTQAQSTSTQHIGIVPTEEDQRVYTAVQDIQRRVQQPPTRPTGQTLIQAMSTQHIGNAPMKNEQKAQLDVSLHDHRLQDSKHYDQIKPEGEQRGGERGSNDEIDASRHDEDTTEDDIRTDVYVPPSVSRRVTFEMRQDVDDGRVIDVKRNWLESVLEKEPFASGKSGKVFKSKEIPEWEIKIAVKEIQYTKYNARAAQNEVIAARLRHHAIVPLLGRCREKNHLYFVFPFMENGNLRDAIKQDVDNRELRMDVTKRVFILYKISCAILYIHTKVQDLRPQMVHGDITTTNIVLDRNDNPRLLDFGVARLLKDEDGVILKDGDQIGAYTTMVAKKRLTLETDYRSFGVVILEMLTGEDNPKQLKEFRDDLQDLEKLYDDCFEKVWKHDEEIYKKLKELAGQCLKGKVEAEQITEDLCKILNNIIGYNWTLPKDEKCSMCMINLAVNKPDFNLYVENCRDASCKMTKPTVCVACMRNSYLNPIQCLACRQNVHTKIGTCWAAILITGYDKTDQSVFQQDTDLIRDTLTSRYPLITGLSLENVYCINMDELEDTVKKLKGRPFIKSVFIYYSGHYYKDKGFQTDECSFKSKEEFVKHVEPLEQDIILVTDCCFSEELKEFCPNISIQIGASGSEETAEFKRSGSVFTKYFIHSLKGKSQGSPCPLTKNFSCEICNNYKPEEEKVGFISVRSMFINIRDHMEKHYDEGPFKSCSPFLSIGKKVDGCFIGYHISEKTEIKFGIEDYAESEQPANAYKISELPKEMKDLRIKLFREVLKQKSINTDRHQGLWDAYSDVITVIVREGPHKEHKTELPTIAKVSDAVMQKFDISCSLRQIEELDNGKVGMFLTDVTAGKIVEFLDGRSHDGLNVQRQGEKEDVITIDWKKIKDFSVMNIVKGEERVTEDMGNAKTWLMDKLRYVAKNYRNMEAKKLVMTIPFGECSTVCETAKNFLVIEIRKEEEGTR